MSAAAAPSVRQERPSDTVAELLRERDELARRLRPFGNPPRRGRSGDWHIGHRAPAELVRRLDEARQAGRQVEMLERRNHDAG